jgi:cytochrome c oxidase subunit 2
MNHAMFDPQGPAALRIADLGWFLFALLGAVYVLVLAATWWAGARRRRDGDAHPTTDRQLTRWVAGASLLTAGILVVLTVVSVNAGRGLTTLDRPGALTVDVIGHQWWWDFNYPSPYPPDVVSSPNELHIPVGVPVLLNVVSRDVIHSFWVPTLHGKRDLVPGQVTQTWIQADRPGVFRGQCAEFCGHQHARMALLVIAEPMAEFQAWLRQQRRPAAEPAADEERRGRDIFLSSPCASCHSVRGTPAGSRFGPDLTHVGSRRTIAAGTLPNTDERLGAWIADAQAIKPGSRMPSHVLGSDDVQAVRAYLRSLR